MTLQLDFGRNGLAIVVGASGGIGQAIANLLKAEGSFAEIIETQRHGGQNNATAALDLMSEDSIIAVADKAKATGLDLRLVFDATGYLHGDQGGPEKTWSAIDPGAMAHQFAINTIGPALLVKHFLPLMPRQGKAVFATISAKVGSIGDNRLGGWYGYRASKAGLNQIIKTASIELARKRKEAVCLALHPGTVATRLSDPFAKNGVQLQTPEQSARALLTVIANSTPAQTGQLLSYDGTQLPY